MPTDWQWLAELLYSIAPPNIKSIAGLLAEILPAGSDVVSGYFESASVSLALVLQYFMFLDYFIDLPLYYSVIAFMLVTEGVLLWPRMIKFAKSLFR